MDPRHTDEEADYLRQMRVWPLVSGAFGAFVVILGALLIASDAPQGLPAILRIAVSALIVVLGMVSGALSVFVSYRVRALARRIEEIRRERETSHEAPEPPHSIPPERAAELAAKTIRIVTSLPYEHIHAALSTKAKAP